MPGTITFIPQNEPMKPELLIIQLRKLRFSFKRLPSRLPAVNGKTESELRPLAPASLTAILPFVDAEVEVETIWTRGLSNKED